MSQADEPCTLEMAMLFTMECETCHQEFVQRLQPGETYADVSRVCVPCEVVELVEGQINHFEAAAVGEFYEYSPEYLALLEKHDNRMPGEHGPDELVLPMEGTYYVDQSLNESI